MKEPFLIHFMKLVLTLLPRPGKHNSKKEYRPISFISIEEKISSQNIGKYNSAICTK